MRFRVPQCLWPLCWSMPVTLLTACAGQCLPLCLQAVPVNACHAVDRLPCAAQEVELVLPDGKRLPRHLVATPSSTVKPSSRGQGRLFGNWQVVQDALGLHRPDQVQTAAAAHPAPPHPACPIPSHPKSPFLAILTNTLPSDSKLYPVNDPARLPLRKLRLPTHRLRHQNVLDGGRGDG